MGVKIDVKSHTGYLVRLTPKILAVVAYPEKLEGLQLSSPGHGWFSIDCTEKDIVAKPSEYELIPVKRGIFKPNDVGAVVTREQLREVLERVDTAGGGSGGVSAHSSVHWCRRCGPCKCIRERKGVIL